MEPKTFAVWTLISLGGLMPNYHFSSSESDEPESACYKAAESFARATRTQFFCMNAFDGTVAEFKAPVDDEEPDKDKSE